jgi:hypothetical protein
MSVDPNLEATFLSALKKHFKAADDWQFETTLTFPNDKGLGEGKWEIFIYLQPLSVASLRNTSPLINAVLARNLFAATYSLWFPNELTLDGKTDTAYMDDLIIMNEVRYQTPATPLAFNMKNLGWIFTKGMYISCNKEMTVMYRRRFDLE